EAANLEARIRRIHRHANGRRQRDFLGQLDPALRQPPIWRLLVVLVVVAVVVVAAILHPRRARQELQEHVLEVFGVARARRSRRHGSQDSELVRNMRPVLWTSRRLAARWRSVQPMNRDRLVALACEGDARARTDVVRWLSEDLWKFFAP